MTVFFTNNFNKTRFDRRRRSVSAKLHDEHIFMRWVNKKMFNSNSSLKVRDKMRFHCVKRRLFITKRDQGVSRVVNRCIFTDTPHSINKQFRISRMTFKEFVSLRYLTGVTQLPVRK